MKILFAFLIFTFTISVFGQAPAAGYKPGDKAIDFKLKSVDGKEYGLSSFPEAAGYIVVFTCNHCPFAIKYEDRLNELYKKYANQGFKLIAINPNDPEVQPADSYEKMKEKAIEKGFEFPYLFDEGQKIFPQYGATKTPHVFLIDRSYIVRYIGAIDDNAEDASQVKQKYLEDAIKAISENLEPNPAVTKAIGCSIKVKKP